MRAHKRRRTDKIVMRGYTELFDGELSGRRRRVRYGATGGCACGDIDHHGDEALCWRYDKPRRRVKVMFDFRPSESRGESGAAILHLALTESCPPLAPLCGCGWPRRGGLMSRASELGDITTP
jgi:hypothetical protein